MPAKGDHMPRPILGLAFLLVLALAAAPAHAAAAACEASGKVVDRDGNPLQGAVITFTSKSNPTMPYTGKTNKKGRYFVAGMFAVQGDEWNVMVEYEGYLPVEMFIESRTVNRVLVGDPYTKKLKPDSGPWGLVIRPMGIAKVDFTMAPAEEVRQVEPVAPAAGSTGVPAAPAAPRRDPWDEALTRASDGDLDGAVPLFEEAVEEEPEDAERRRAFAKVLYQLGRLDEAEAQALAVVELEPADIEARMVLYSVYVGKQDLDRARMTLEEARELAPEDLRLLKQLAFVAGESGTPADAIAAWEAVVRVAPDDTEAWMSLGDLYAASGNSAKSEEAYRRVTELEPENAHQIFFNLGALIINKPDRTDADTQKAIGAFRKAVELKPDYAQAHKQLAFALLGAGDRAGAKSALERYVQLAPDAPDAAQMQALINTLGK
jgi:Flp pilus assembly protein TadD